MRKKASSTKRTPSNSKPKPKPAPKKRAVKKDDWRVFWIRTISGEEYVANAKILSDGVVMYDPTVITYLQGNMVLAPYGLISVDRSFFFAGESILHLNEVTEPIKKLYFTSLDHTLDYCQEHFDALVVKSTETVRRAASLTKGSTDVEPSAKDMAEIVETIEEMLNQPKEFDGSTEKPRTRTQTIDDLVKLAEAKGKGKNPGGET